MVCEACGHVQGQEGGVVQGPGGERGQDRLPGSLLEEKHVSLSAD